MLGILLHLKCVGILYIRVVYVSICSVFEVIHIILHLSKFTLNHNCGDTMTSLLGWYGYVYCIHYHRHYVLSVLCEGL